MSAGASSLLHRVVAGLDVPDGPRAGERVSVAFSGGLDSTVLLHVLRFALAERGLVVSAAHFDHGMRPGSAADASWVRGLCRAWDVPLDLGRPEVPPTSESSARDARYTFLNAVRTRSGARWLLTAHHADDQAETVLFRLLRGTGPGGLRGIPAFREPWLLRPLLAIWREELEEYARAAKLSWREDPTNESLGFARNALRRRVLPDVERFVAPGARRALVRLASLAEDEEAGWASIMEGLLRPLDVQPNPGGVSFRRDEAAALHPAVRARALRALCARIGGTLDASATNRAVAFSQRGPSGGRIDLGGGLVLARELDRLVMGRNVVQPEDRPLAIPDARPGEGEALLGGRAVRVSWGGGELLGGWAEWFCREELRFPLLVRARRPGDRIVLASGSRKLKKILLDARMPLAERPRVPVVVDALGEVLWVPGVARRRVDGLSNSRIDGFEIGVGP